jgi:hypothetical protein
MTRNEVIVDVVSGKIRKAARAVKDLVVNAGRTGRYRRWSVSGRLDFRNGKDREFGGSLHLEAPWNLFAYCAVHMRDAQSMTLCTDT